MRPTRPLRWNVTLVSVSQSATNLSFILCHSLLWRSLRLLVVACPQQRDHNKLWRWSKAPPLMDREDKSGRWIRRVTRSVHRSRSELCACGVTRALPALPSSLSLTNTFDPACSSTRPHTSSSFDDQLHNGKPREGSARLAIKKGSLRLIHEAFCSQYSDEDVDRYQQGPIKPKTAQPCSAHGDAWQRRVGSGDFRRQDRALLATRYQMSRWCSAVCSTYMSPFGTGAPLLGCVCRFCTIRRRFRSRTTIVIFPIAGT